MRKQQGSISRMFSCKGVALLCFAAVFLMALPLEAQPLRLSSSSLWLASQQQNFRIASPRFVPRQFKRLSIEEGLSQSSVNGIMQDSKGFLWFTTQEGLNKYDGYTFTIFKAESGDSSGGLPINWVLGICEDREGTLWVGTKGMGVCRFHPQTGKWTRISTKESGLAGLKGKLSNDFVNVLLTDRNGLVWMGTDNGVTRYDPRTNSLHQFTHHPDNPHSLSGTFVYAIVEDAQGHIWIGTDYGLNRFIPEIQGFETIYFDIDDTSVNNSINAIAPDAQGRLWLGTFNGLGLYDPRTNTVRSFLASKTPNKRSPHHDPLYNTLPSNNVFALLIDRDSTLWIGTQEGLCLLPHCNTVQRGSAAPMFEHCRYSPYSRISLSNNYVRSLYQDRTGVVWIGTFTGGVNSWSRYRFKFPLYTDNAVVSGDSATTIYRSVRAFYEERYEERATTPTIRTGTPIRLWIGGDNGVLFIDYATGHKTVFPTNPSGAKAEGVFVSKALVNAQIWTIHKDRHGLYWFGSNGGGMQRYDAATGVVKHFRHDERAPTTSLSHNSVRSFLEDTQGRIWIATLKGLNLFQPTTETFLQYFHDPSNPNSLSDSRITCIFEDTRRLLWIGTSVGLNIFDPEHGVFTRFYRINDSASLSSHWIKCVTEDRKGRIWIATTEGLTRFDRSPNNPKQGVFTRLGLREGLANAHIYGVVEDDDGKIWVSTNRGLAYFDETAQRFATFDVGDGLQSNEFNTNAFYKTSRGELLFGGVNGFNAFLPQHLQENSIVPQMALTSLKVFGQKRSFSSENDSLYQVLLPHTDNVVEIGFAALDFTNSERNTYRYKLDGIDRQWTNAETRNFANYTNLPPGVYQFWVQGANSDGVWNEAGVRLMITILPPFWHTWWFRTLVTVVIMGIVFGIYRWRVQAIERQTRFLEQQVADRTYLLQERTRELERINQQLAWANSEIIRQNEALKTLNDEKNEFLGIAAHDMKNPLARIISLADMMNLDAEEFTDKEIREFATMISSSAARMLEMVKNLLNINAIERGAFQLTIETLDIAAVLRNIVDEYTMFAAEKHITIHLHLPHGQTVVAADKAALTQVLDNLLSNALKYSPDGKNVWIRAESLPNNTTRIALQDEGPGFTEEDKKRMFQRFSRLSAQPTGDEHSTGLGLSIVKRLVEAMNGSIVCESSPETGSIGATFFLTLPSKDFTPLLAE